MNSTLQALVAAGTLAGFPGVRDADGGIAAAFGAFWTQATAPSRPATLAPKAVLSAVSARRPSFRGFGQQDAHELLVTVLEGIGEENAKLFSGKFRSTVVCGVCGTPSKTYTMFETLEAEFPEGASMEQRRRAMPRSDDDELSELIASASLDEPARPWDAGPGKKPPAKAAAAGLDKHLVAVRPAEAELRAEGRLTVEAMLRSFFTAEPLETMYECETCKKKKRGRAANSWKQFLIEEMPQILVVCLKRFKTTARGRTCKVNEHVISGATLDLSNVAAENSDAAAEDGLYDLAGVVVHAGGMGGGHYTANVRRGGAWYDISDAHVGRTTLERALRAEPYLLFYVRRK